MSSENKTMTSENKTMSSENKTMSSENKTMSSEIGSQDNTRGLFLLRLFNMFLQANGWVKLPSQAVSQNEDPRVTYNKSMDQYMQKNFPSVLVTIQNKGHSISYTGIKPKNTCSVWHPSNNFLNFTYERNVPEKSKIIKIDVDLKNRDFTKTPFIVYKKDKNILSVQYSTRGHEDTEHRSLNDTFNKTNENRKSIIFCFHPPYLRPGYERIWYNCKKSQTQWNCDNQQPLGKEMFFKFENEIRLGIPLYYYRRENYRLETNGL